MICHERNIPYGVCVCVCVRARKALGENTNEMHQKARCWKSVRQIEYLSERQH